MRFQLALLLAASASLSSAVVATSTSTPAGADSTWKWVGSINGDSAVAIDQYTVLTAGHVGAGHFILGGVDYGAQSSVSMSGVDLLLVHTQLALPGWYSVASSASYNAPVTMVGNGLTGHVTSGGDGYAIDYSTGGTRRAGTNTLDFEQTFQGYGPLLGSFLSQAGESALASGDSGGGWFQNGKLVGINDAVFNETNGALPDYGFASANTSGWVDPTDPTNVVKAGAPYFGSLAVDLTNSSVQDFIKINTVPEPSSYAIFGLGLIALARRRSRR